MQKAIIVFLTLGLILGVWFVFFRGKVFAAVGDMRRRPRLTDRQRIQRHLGLNKAANGTTINSSNRPLGVERLIRKKVSDVQNTGMLDKEAKELSKKRATLGFQTPVADARQEEFQGFVKTTADFFTTRAPRSTIRNPQTTLNFEKIAEGTSETTATNSTQTLMSKVSPLTRAQETAGALRPRSILDQALEIRPKVFVNGGNKILGTAKPSTTVNPGEEFKRKFAGVRQTGFQGFV